MSKTAVRVDPTAAKEAMALLLHRQGNYKREISESEEPQQSSMGPPWRDHQSGSHAAWTSSEVAELRRLAPLGARVAAQALGRSVSSVRLQAHRQRISLRPPGERRGILLGQSPKVKGPAVKKLRRDVLAGDVDQEVVVHLVELAAQGAPICPMCGREPVETPAGLGQICHNRELALAHELAVDRRTSERDLDAARQRKHRAREKVGL